MMKNLSQDLIIENITRYIPLSDTDKQRFLELLDLHLLKKKQLLLNDGEACKSSIFVISGCLRGYTIGRNEFEHVLNFAPAGCWIADIYGLISESPKTLHIEALEETEVFLLSKSNQEKLYLEVPQFERFFRIITEKSLITYQQRIIDNLSLDAVEGYGNFCSRYPNLISYLPKKQIASYLGITAEFFSRMRHVMAGASNLSSI
jgi:CRP-like cAMP-binding protein